MMAIQFKLNDKLFLRDPLQTKLGRKIIEQSINLIDELGFEKFTFKKLAEKIQSTEASVYRYYENKHKLLLYLVSWYWEWMKYQIENNTKDLDSPVKILSVTLASIVESSLSNPSFEFVDENKLHRIVISEAVKAYHSKDVDEENRAGLFLTYKSLCKVIAKNINNVNPDFPYAHTLASTLVEMTNNNIYFAEHLPSLTDIKLKDGNLDEVKKLLEVFVSKLLNVSFN
jgi:AcrR family transcriptional regulator